MGKDKMSANPYARGFRELIVYQKARSVAKQVFEITKLFPTEERYSLTDQVRRSSRSSGAQIAEAWAKRRYPNHFIAKLSDADGEQNETQHWIETAVDCGYLNADRANSLNVELAQISKMLQSMIERAESFKGPEYSSVREESVSYGSPEELFVSNLNTDLNLKSEY
jgi:four helix bundle protein